VGIADSFSGTSVGIIAASAGILVAAVGGIVAAVWSLWSCRRLSVVARRPETLDGRLDRLAKSMRESGRLASEVSAEVDLLAGVVRELEEKAGEGEPPPALNEDQAETARSLVQASMATEGRRIRRAAVKIAVASFVAGAAATLLVTLLVHPIG
jgi:biopolymer transport protein ExbB/TolQ